MNTIINHAHSARAEAPRAEAPEILVQSINRSTANLIVELALTRAALEKCLITLEHLAAMDHIFKRRKDFWDDHGQGSQALYHARKILQLPPPTPAHECQPH